MKIITKHLLAWRDRKGHLESVPAGSDSPTIVGAPREPEPSTEENYSIEASFSAEIAGHVESQGPGKNVLMPNIYDTKIAATEPLLKILDPSSPEDASTGFNPYDTAVLQKKPQLKPR